METTGWRYTARGRIAIAALAAIYATLSASLLRYQGIQHDAQVYVAQALLRLDPTVLAGDLFFRYGSQDDFTLFPTFAAAWIWVLGIDHGTAALTAVLLMLWFVSAWLLVRRVVGTVYQGLSVALLMVIPGWYGAGEVFQVAERFLTARLGAEALVIVALSAILAGRQLSAAIALAVALLVHPLMTLPALAICAFCLIANRHALLAMPMLAVVLLGATLIAGVLLGLPAPQMSDEWLLALRDRSGFLFLDTWQAPDWQAALCVVVTLALTASLLDKGRARSMVEAAAWVAVTGLAICAITTWAIPLKWVIQIQTWRWAWPATVLAIIALPWTLVQLGRKRGERGTAAAMLLVAAWALGTADRTDTSAAAAGLTLSAIAWLVAHPLLAAVTINTRTWRAVALAVATVILLWVISLAASEAYFDLDLGGDPVWVQKAIALLRIPPAAALCIGAMWLVLLRVRNIAVVSAALVPTLVLLVGASPQALSLWAADPFGRDTQRKFREWRRAIPETDQVFWPNQLQMTWFVLGRKSYLSLSQLGGIVFSEEATEEARRRAAALTPVFPSGLWFNRAPRKDEGAWLTDSRVLTWVCAVPGIDFVVASQDVGVALHRVEWPMPGRFVYLYDCHQLAEGPLAANDARQTRGGIATAYR